MKIVKESLNEIRKNTRGSGLAVIGIGYNRMINDWARNNFDDYSIIDGVIHPSDPDEYPSEKWVESGKIPDYIKIIAFLPFSLLKEDDVVYDFSEYPPAEYTVIEKIAYNDSNIKKIITKIDGLDAYENYYKFHIDNEENLVLVECRYDDGNVRAYLKLYDYNSGVIGTFIYNG